MLPKARWSARFASRHAPARRQLEIVVMRGSKKDPK